MSSVPTKVPELNDGEKLFLGDDNNFSVRKVGRQLVWRDEVNGIDIPILEEGNGNLIATFDVSGGEPVLFGDNDDVALQFDEQDGAFEIVDVNNGETRLSIPILGAMVIGQRNLDVDGSDIDDAGSTVWDSSNSEVPKESLGGPASSLGSYPLQMGDLSIPVSDGLAIDNNNNIYTKVGSGVSIDSSGNVHIADGGISKSMLGFSVLTQNDLDTHAGDAGAHHSKPTSTGRPPTNQVGGTEQLGSFNGSPTGILWSGGLMVSSLSITASTAGGYQVDEDISYTWYDYEQSTEKSNTVTLATSGTKTHNKGWDKHVELRQVEVVNSSGSAETSASAEKPAIVPHIHEVAN